MTRILKILAIIIASIIIPSCKSYHGTMPAVEIRTSERTVIKKDTVYVEIPQHISIHTSADSISVLEDDFAISEAIINPDGTLTHKLQSKPAEIPIEVESQVVYRDSIAIIEKPIQAPADASKERISQWDRFRIKAFGILLAIAILLSAWTFRKSIATFLRRIFRIKI